MPSIFVEGNKEPLQSFYGRVKYVLLSHKLAMRDWVERVKEAGASLYGEGLIMQKSPEEDVCVSYGKEFAAF